MLSSIQIPGSSLRCSPDLLRPSIRPNNAAFETMEGWVLQGSTGRGRPWSCGCAASASCGGRRHLPCSYTSALIDRSSQHVHHPQYYAEPQIQRLTNPALLRCRVGVLTQRAAAAAKAAWHPHALCRSMLDPGMALANSFEAGEIEALGCAAWSSSGARNEILRLILWAADECQDFRYLLSVILGILSSSTTV